MNGNDKMSNEATTQTEQPMSNKKFATVMASPILIPMALVTVMLYGILLGCGWFFVAITYFTAIAAVGVGVLGIIGAYMNMANGLGAVLLLLGSGIFSLGFVYPIFVIAKEFSKGYSALYKQLLIKGKELKGKVMKGL